MLIGRFGGGDVGAREHLIDVINELRKRLGFAVAGLGELHAEVSTDVAGIAAQHNDAVGQQHGFFNVVRHQEDSLGGHGFVSPQFQQFTAQILSGQHVQGAERP